jgi:hypothetical protein
VVQFPGTLEIDSLAADTQGNIYVGDVMADQIDQFSPSGALMRVEGAGDDPNAVGDPASMSMSSDGR